MPPTATVDQDKQQAPTTLLIAQLRAHLNNGDTLELLPIQHDRDVKHEVESLVQSWSESGFLLHGRHLYPWHQVQRVEVVNVEELPKAVAEQRLNDMLGADRTRVQESFWRTKHDDSDKKK